jgi:TetR/AcrR family transcriptional regulator, repressor for neighboring sulfatase
MWPMATPVNAGDQHDAPRGRDEIVDAALDAAERLFATAGPRSVSMRDIAREAGVTYSLVNRHLGTKDDLLDHLLARYERRWREGLPADASLADAAGRLLGENPEAGAYLRLLAWSLLADGAAEVGGDGATGQGGDGAEPYRRHAALDELLPKAGELGLTDAGAEARVAAMLALIFGWRFFAPFITQALHVDDAAEVHASVARLVDRLGSSPT